MIRVLHTADWHIGDFPGPTEAGKNLRALDTLRCIDTVVDTSKEMNPDIAMISGDIFHQAKVWGSRALDEVGTAIDAIEELARNTKDKTIVMRGTPNHDGEEQFDMLAQYFRDNPKVEIVTEPMVIQCEGMDVACIPGFDRGAFRAQFPGLGKEEEDEAITHELSNICIGLKAEARTDVPVALMAHYTVPGCNAEAGQSTFLQHFEPILPTDALAAADYDLICLGHIHRPQQLQNVKKCFYSGAVNAMNFNDEDQIRGFWIHDVMSAERIESQLFLTPYREFLTIHLDDSDVSQINSGAVEFVALTKWKDQIKDKIVRVLYECSLDNNKALNKAVLEKQLIDDGAFHVWEITPAKLSVLADRQNMESQTDPEENLRKYLAEKGYDDEKISQLISKAREIIATATANNTSALLTGVFEPVSIDVKNYRNYVEEHFDFSDISFCTINGQNGSGKSSLFMDAIMDCLYEEPREGDLTGWIRNDEKARSGSIAFVFKIGDQTFRVTRTRARSGKGTLNLSELEKGEWQDRSCEKYRDTQTRIEQLLGMDSMTFKSCALIMQDQYGLFLQTPKEDRMVILGNLLGLNIYILMEKAARDTAKVFGAKMRDTKNAITLHEATIASYGDPQADLVVNEKKMADLQELVREAKDQEQMELKKLAVMQDAQQKEAALTKEANNLAREVIDIDSRIKETNQIVASCQLKLSEESEIKEHMKEYNEAKDLLEFNAGPAAQYSIKQAEADRLTQAHRTLSMALESAKHELDQDRQKRNTLIAESCNDGEIFLNAELYESKSKEYDALKHKESEYLMALTKVSAKDREIGQLHGQFDAEAAIIKAREGVLKQKTELLQSSGCIDPDHANCEFLKDAIAAKAELESIPYQYTELESDFFRTKEKLEAEKVDLQNQVDAVGFDKDRLNTLIQELVPLRDYVDKAKEANDRKQRLALIEAALEPKQVNIADMEQRLITAVSEANSAQSEAQALKISADLHRDAMLKIRSLEMWAQKDTELPVIRERYNNAVSRLSSDKELLNKTVERMEEKQAAALVERAKTAELTETKYRIQDIRETVNQTEDHISAIQKMIGASQQKISDIAKIREQISGLQKDVQAFSAETADYDILKAAFSQDGIPHQIIRSVIPQLTDTANTILGQMTGGKMGVEFKTERTMKSNSNKEVVTLDILIEEYGKGTLPYLSKSGGEKVKASLSVILSLAEMKSTAAGIQLGMLFIDEPPFLDSDGIQAYCDALETIQNRYPTMKIMAITHDPTMKARFPQSLDVVKTEAGSKVIY